MLVGRPGQPTLRNKSCARRCSLPCAPPIGEQLVAPAYLRLLLTGEPLDDALIADSVQRTLVAFTG